MKKVDVLLIQDNSIDVGQSLALSFRLGVGGWGGGAGGGRGFPTEMAWSMEHTYNCSEGGAKAGVVCVGGTAGGGGEAGNMEHTCICLLTPPRIPP